MKIREKFYAFCRNKNKVRAEVSLSRDCQKIGILAKRDQIVFILAPFRLRNVGDEGKNELVTFICDVSFLVKVFLKL